MVKFVATRTPNKRVQRSAKATFLLIAKHPAPADARR
jgi:hypothetical protein